nr:hypothetical protein [Kibdelosporangium sp. MJ126-NF4]CEL21658.1 hypothetical protein [Kibdelosporangium sp. MJ126-NF4]CTQ92439.1 hypothetical protein [Kibdelosporangium sp. MJ126-NF4]
MNTDELRTALRDATPEMQPRPSLTADVLRGGVRRLRVRRITIAATAMAVVAAVSVTATAGWQALSEPNEPATNPLMLEPTHGDLAKDSAFIDDVLDAWDDKPTEPSVKVTSKPHVYWAGNTPAGRAAVVMQETDTKDTLRGLVGVDVKTKKLALLILDEPAPRQGQDMGYRFGQEDRVVLVLKQDQPVHVSAKVIYDQNGKATRSWQPMRDVDAMELAELPPGTGPVEARAIKGDPANGLDGDRLIDLYPADEAAVMADKRSPAGMNWGDGTGTDHLMWARPGQPPAHWDDAGWLGKRWHKGMSETDLLDPVDAGGIYGDSAGWFATTTGPDSTTYLIGEYVTPESGPTRLYAVAILPSGEVDKVYPAGATNRESPLPVLAQLPDKNTKVAVVKGAKLSYRTTKDGPWLEDADEALRVPKEAVEVRVTKPGQAPAIVPVDR